MAEVIKRVVFVCVSPERKGCLHTVSTRPQSEVYSDSTSRTPEALLSDHTKTSPIDQRHNPQPLVFTQILRL